MIGWWWTTPKESFWQFNTVIYFVPICCGGKSGWVQLKKTKCPAPSGSFEGVGGGVVEAGISEDRQGAHSGEDDEKPEEHAVHNHGHILPVLLQLDQDGWKGGCEKTEWKEER